MPGITTLEKGSSIGIIGDGQLGRYIAKYGQELGYTMVVLGPGGKQSPAGQVANEVIQAQYDDMEALNRFAEMIRVATIEFENIPEGVLKFIESKGVFIGPSSKVLYISRNRIREKTFMRDIGIKTVEWMNVEGKESIEIAREKHQFMILKTTELGYDGKGQFRITPNTNIDELRNELTSQGLDKEGMLILEEEIQYYGESSLIVARNQEGEIQTFLPSENLHENGILRFSLTPGRFSQEQIEKMNKIAITIAERIGLVGILCVEMFITINGEILVNEIAPRPHNSGHQTMDICDNNQYSMLIRAITAMELKKPSYNRDAVLVNLLGDELETFGPHFSNCSDETFPTKVYDYGKVDSKPGRKMGHATMTMKKGAISQRYCNSQLGIGGNENDSQGDNVLRDEYGLNTPGKTSYDLIQTLDWARNPFNRLKFEYVHITCGSASDYELLMNNGFFSTLDEIGVPYACSITSVHKYGDQVMQLGEAINLSKKVKIVAAAAGGSAHLPMVLNGKVICPTIGLAISKEKRDISHENMLYGPTPTSLSTFHIDSKNGANASLHIAELLAQWDENIMNNLLAFKKKNADTNTLESRRLAVDLPVGKEMKTNIDKRLGK